MRITIKNKIFVSFTFLILIALLVMGSFINSALNKYNHNTITKELKKSKSDIEVYVRQFFLSNNLPIDEVKFTDKSLDILEDLNTKLKVDGVIYVRNSDGGIPTLVSKRDPERGSEFVYKNNDDLMLAFGDKTAYTIDFGDGSVWVYFSSPITIDGKLLGIYRFAKDYTALYESSGYLMNIIVIIVLILLLMAFAVSFLISRSITIPLVKLSRISNELAGGNFDVDMDIDSNDEIGDLSRNFDKMKNQIHTHIKTIERDHVMLKELESHRKRFFDNVAHELKTPLTIIHGYAQIIEENGFTDDEFFKKGIKHILDESDRLHRMVFSLLEVSRQTSVDASETFEDVDISELLKLICDEMSVKALKYGGKISCDLQPGIIVNGNAYELRSAFINIIDNSIKYTDSDPLISVKAIKNGEWVNISIQDNGMGIPEDMIGKIFEPFYRVKSQQSKEYGSSGLGLYIVKTVIENHKGTISIDSTEKSGTTVKIFIPVKGDVNDEF